MKLSVIQEYNLSGLPFTIYRKLYGTGYNRSNAFYKKYKASDYYFIKLGEDGVEYITHPALVFKGSVFKTWFKQTNWKRNNLNIVDFFHDGR